MKHGTRDTLVFIPGTACDARLFAPQIAAFQGQFDVRVPIPAEDSISDMADAVLAGLPDEPVCIAGLSMGGIIAMDLVDRFPGRVKQLALLNTNHHTHAEETKAARRRQMEEVRAGHLRAVIVEEMKPVYLAKANRNRADLLTLFVDMAVGLGPEVFLKQCQALLCRRNYGDALRRYGGKTLVLCGAEDALCQPSRHEEIAELLPNARLQILSDVGHISTLEAPDMVTHEMRVWLSFP